MADALHAGRGSFPVGITLSMGELAAAPGGEARLAQAVEHLEDCYLRDLAGDDFVGVQTYSRTVFGPEGPLRPGEGLRRTKMGYEYRPEAVAHTVRRAAAMTGLPVVVTEMGISTDDDAERIEFIDAVVGGIASCLNDGVDVRGIFYWTLLDNFEWSLGYSQPFGLIACDRRTFERRPKPSATHWGRVARSVRSPVPVDAAQ
jgi:beta-glucosidase